MYTSEDFTSDHPSVTRARAIILCNQHGAEFADFLADCPDAEGYERVDTASLLGWLGY